jgi:ferritin-like metal-binding protein YciE
MQPDSKLQEKLITYLQDMHAVENHLVDVLGKQVQETKNVPVFQAKIQEHLEQTKQHRARLEECLKRYGKSPSGVKSALTGLMGSLQGAMSGTRSDSLAKSARDDFVAENFEIASYEELIATALACGDQQTAQTCQLNLHDEVVTAKWLENHMTDAALLTLQMDGIAIPQGAIQQEQMQVRSIMGGLWQEANQVASVS